MPTTFDFIIIGAGSAGCVLANRLSADPRTNVLLLEAGPPDNDLFIHMPAGFSHTSGRERINWGYVSLPQPHVGGRSFVCPRGKVLGGSSAINAMCFVRGHRQDFDDWAKAGLTGWSYDHCLPYFKRMETFSRGADEYRGGDGPLNVTSPVFSNPLNEVFLTAAEEAGYARLADTNGAGQEGFGPADQTIHNGRRVSAATAYLAPVRHRPNLEVLTGAETTRILFENGRAKGVVYKRGGEEVIVTAAVEVISAAGAINSPKLLMLSGIGRAKHLSPLGIDVVADLPGVGQNLQDHMDVSIKTACNKPVSFMPVMRYPRKALTGLRWLLLRSGLAATNHFEAAGYIRTRQDRIQPNVQLLFIPMMYNEDGSPLTHRHGYQVTVMPLRPKSRGELTLTSADPHAPPRLNYNYLQHRDDLTELRDGIKHLRRILSQPAFAPYRGAELEPGSNATSDAAIDAHILKTVKSNYHPCGTCRMGTGDDAVVDADGRVRGVEGLRVVDASIMPGITSGNINAPTLMLAEKMSDAILARPAP